jgi:hypothetical protein
MTSGIRSALLVVALLAPSIAAAQATTDLPLSDEAHRRLSRLIALDLVDTAIVGQRPYSRREAARMVASARRAMATAPRPAAAEHLVASLERELRDPGHTALLDRAGLTLRATNSAPRTFPDDGLGGVDAWLSPLVGARGTEPIARGGAAMLQTQHSARLSNWLVAEARPRLVSATRTARGPDRAPALDIDVAYVRAQAGSFMLDVGRSELSFGQGTFSTLGMTEHAPPLLMARLSTDRPIHVPLFSRIAGPVRGTLFVADLGAEQNYPHARLAGWKLNFLPHRRLELGVNVLSQQGGGGAPPAPFGERVLDLLPLYDAIFVTDRDFEISNKLSGIEFRYRMPWRPIELHGELLIDDWDERRLASTLWEDAGYVVGMTAPVVYSDGRLTLAAEAHHTGLRMYRHGDFTSGVATRGRLIGNPLGPNANAGYLRLSLDRGFGTTWEVDGAYEFRSGRRYITSGGIGEETLVFHLTGRQPAEYRRRLVVRGRDLVANRYPFARDLRTLGEAGVEWVRNDAHGTGSRVNFLGRVGVEVLF